MKYKTLTAPLSVQVEITDLCNQGCQHCYNFWRQNAIKKEKILDEQQITKIISILAQKKVFGVVFTGGEPLLNDVTKSTTLRGIKEASKLNIWPSVNTNLTTITKEDALRLKEAGVVSILTSILSFDPKTHNKIVQTPNSFERVIRGIKIVKSVKIPLSVSMVLLKMNSSHVYKTGELVSNLGVKSFNVTRVVPPFGCSKNFSEFVPSKKEILNSLDMLSKLKEDFGLRVGILEPYPYCLLADSPRYYEFLGRHCTAGILTCAIGADGKIRPCPHINTNYGNILREPFGLIWKRMGTWRTKPPLPKKCLTCEAIELCRGGCRINAFYKQGKFNDLDPLASPTKIPYIRNLIKTQKKKNLFMTVKLSQLMSFPPGINFRKESFGGIVGLGPSKVVFLKKGSFLLLSKLKVLHPIFSLKDIIGLYGISDKKATNLLIVLLTKGIIKKREGGGN